MIELKTPISDEEIKKLKVGDRVTISGRIYTGRDAVLPQLVKLAKSGKLIERGIQLQGSVIFHTAVSPAGVGPTSSNKYEIESCFEILSREGVRLHLGKGAIGSEAVKILDDYQSVFAVIAPVTALLTSRTLEKKVIAFPELGMEALHELVIEGYPAIIAAAHNQTIY
jgi:fumarate hydratase subunit beta